MELVIVVAGAFVILAAIVGITYLSINLGEHIKERYGRGWFWTYLVGVTLLMLVFVSALVWVIYTNGLYKTV